MDYIGKGEMLINRDVNKFVHQISEKKYFVRMEHFWDLLFQLMKNGTIILYLDFCSVIVGLWVEFKQLLMTLQIIYRPKWHC
jgi:hypothetical protein